MEGFSFNSSLGFGVVSAILINVGDVLLFVVVVEQN